MAQERTVGPRSLKSAGINQEFLKAPELAKSRVPVLIEGCVERYDHGSQERKIKASWRLDFQLRLLGGEARGSSGILSLGRDDTTGNVIVSRMRMARALATGVLGPFVVTKGEGQQGYVNFEDYVPEGKDAKLDASALWDKLTKDLPIETTGFQREGRDTREAEGTPRQRRDQRQKPRRAQVEDDDFPDALEEEDDDLPF